MSDGTLTHVSLFSGGLDGASVAAYMAGFTTTALCEIDPWNQNILRHHWPEARVYGDIRDVTRERLWADGVGVPTVLSGGPPCQPASAAGQRRGSADDRWLWPEYIRAVGDLEPRWFVAENPTGLLSLRHNGGRGEPAVGGILRELSALGYVCGWGTWGAAHVGAPHQRDRVFLIGRRIGGVGGVGQADPQGTRLQEQRRQSIGAAAAQPRFANGGEDVALANGGRRGGRASRTSRHIANGQETGWLEGNGGLESGGQVGSTAVVADPNCPRPQGRPWRGEPRQGRASSVSTSDVRGQRGEGAAQSALGAATDGLAVRLVRLRWPAGQGPRQYPWEEARLVVGRVPWRKEMLRAIGNGIVWQQMYPVFAAIAELEKERGGAS